MFSHKTGVMAKQLNVPTTEDANSRKISLSVSSEKWTVWHYTSRLFGMLFQKTLSSEAGLYCKAAPLPLILED